MGKSAVHPVCLDVCLYLSGRVAHVLGDFLSPRVDVCNLICLGFSLIPELPQLGSVDPGVLSRTTLLFSRRGHDDFDDHVVAAQVFSGVSLGDGGRLVVLDEREVWWCLARHRVTHSRGLRPVRDEGVVLAHLVVGSSPWHCFWCILTTDSSRASLRTPVIWISLPRCSPCAART